MKRFLSVVLSLVMAISVFALATIPAMAKTVKSPESTTKSATVSVLVNGSTSDDISYEKDPTDPTKITFTYNGSGELEGWDFNIEEGVDYEVISEDGNSITIQLINGYDGEVIADAKVKTDSTESTTKKTGKTDGSNKSPATGAVTVTGLGVACAGAALLSVLKKKD